MKEINNLVTHCLRALKIGEMAAIAQQGKAGTGDCLCDMGCTLHRDVIMLSVNDQCGDG